MRYLLVLMTLVAGSCAPSAEHGHDHETPVMDATIWTDTLELYVEFPPLVVDKTSSFQAHFTLLESHQPVREGMVTVSLIKDGKGIRHRVEEPVQAGIFTLYLQPKEVGIYHLTFHIKTSDFELSLEAGKVEVYPSAEDAVVQSGAHGDPAVIIFSKEQAWRTEFQTAPVLQGEVYDVINTSGVWQAAPGAFKSVAANASGVVNFAMDNLTVGTEVKPGQLLMTINSKGFTTNNWQSEIEKSKVNFELARSEYDRKKKLFDARIVPKSEFEQVEGRYQVAEAYYKTLIQDYHGGSKQVRAPFEGYVKSISVENGGYVEQGNAIVTIGTHHSHLLQTEISPALLMSTDKVHNIWYQKSSGQWSNINQSGGSVLSIGKEVEPDHPLIPLYAQVNEEINKPHGSFTEVQIALGESRQSLLVPETALLEDYGSYSVMVQRSGEKFERRPVKIGRRNGIQAEVVEGLTANEYVVTKGAYQVKMAAMTGQAPGHGHAH